MKMNIKCLLFGIVLALAFSATHAQRLTPPNQNALPQSTSRQSTFTLIGNGRATPTRIPMAQSTSTTTTPTSSTPTTQTSTTKAPTPAVAQQVNETTIRPESRKLTPANVDNLPMTPQNQDNLPTTPSSDLPPTPDNNIPSSTTSQSLPTTPLQTTPASTLSTSILSTRNTPQGVGETSSSTRTLPQNTPLPQAASTSPSIIPDTPGGNPFPPTSTSSSLGPTATLSGTWTSNPLITTSAMISTTTNLLPPTTSSTTTFVVPPTTSTTTTVIPPTTSTTTTVIPLTTSTTTTVVPLTTSTSTTTTLAPTTSIFIPPTTTTITISPTTTTTTTTPPPLISPWNTPFLTSTTTTSSGPTVSPPLPSQTTFNPIITSWTSAISPIRPANEIVNGNPVNVLLMLCNSYSLVSPPSNMDAYLYQIQQQLINQFGPNFDSYRIAQMTLSSNPDTGRLNLQFVVRPGQGISNSEVLAIINSKNFNIVDINGNVFDTSCNDFKVIPWSEYWLCPDRRCSNDGMCMVSTAGQYSCNCKNMYVGKYCETNLWPLLAIPAILFLLGLLLLSLCLWCCRRRRRLQTTKSYVNMKTEEKKDIEANETKPEIDRPKPTQTFYLPYNRPLSVGFSDSRFTSVNAMTAMEPNVPKFGGVYGVPSGVTMGMEDPDLYYQSMGQKMALAFNDYTFAPNARASSAGSVVFPGNSYPTGGSGVVNLNPTFTSHDDDMDDIANDGTGYYHALGQKLAITFDKQN